MPLLVNQIHGELDLKIDFHTKSVIYISSRCTKVIKRVFKTHKVGFALCWKFEDYTGNKHKGQGLRKFTKKVKVILRGPKSGPFSNSSIAVLDDIGHQRDMEERATQPGDQREINE